MLRGALIGNVAIILAATPAFADVPGAVINSLSAPDTVDTRAGKLDFRDGVPTEAAAQKAYDALDFANALNVYNNSFRGASALAIVKGFQGIGAKPGDVVIFSQLMDSSSLFLTPNADTIYYLTGLDLSKGPVVIEQPSGGIGTINDMWFSWIIDIGASGPDRGLGGKYLIVGPDYKGPFPRAAISSLIRRRTSPSMRHARTLSGTIRNPLSTTSSGT